MAKNSNQKKKLLVLERIFSKKTDSEHGLTMPQILEELEKYDIKAERKSVYDDIETLKELGIEIESVTEGNKCYYSLVNRQFELAELKMLVDSIQSSNFLTERKSSELIKKLENCTSEHEARKLQRQVHVSGRIKTMNESIYYNVDNIHTAIGNNRAISFKYFHWDVKKNPQLRNEGNDYIISPWSLMWESDNYYLIGYDAKSGLMKHYRVDKMKRIKILDERRDGKEEFAKIDLASYDRKYFGMYKGNEEMVTLEFENSMANVVVDRFGKDYIFVPTDDNHFKMSIKLSISEQFFGWLVGLGTKVRIVGPESVKQEFVSHMNSINKLY